MFRERATYDVKILHHSNSSQKVVGKYYTGVTREEVESEHRGTWGGRFEKFADGEFVYIAQTE